MKILMVIDQFYAANNGTTISARRFAEVLRQHGHEVRIASTGKPEQLSEGETAYLMEKQYIPVFDKLVSSQGMTFAKTDEKLLEEGIAWADIVHFLVPFALTHHGLKIAERMHKPFTAAFHVQPENVSSSIHLGKVDFVNAGIYHWFHYYVYKNCEHIHCPSQFIADELRKHGYTGQLHVISNGIDPDFVYRKLPKDASLAGKFVILMVGRLSIEKRQDVLIGAVAKSRHRDEIQLVLAGKGPRQEALEKQADQLGLSVRFGFYPKPQLLDLIAMSDLYVHAADMEIEAMSCMEAFAGGLVPIIANSPKSATPQFAIDSRSLFEAGNSSDLADHIDYWFEHPEERQQMEHAYAELAKQYNLEQCVRQAEAMFEQAIAENKENAQPAEAAPV